MVNRSHDFVVAPLNGFLSGASLCGTAPGMPRRSQFNARRRWRSQTVIGSGLAPSAAFGSRAARPLIRIGASKLARLIPAWCDRAQAFPEGHPGPPGRSRRRHEGRARVRARHRACAASPQWAGWPDRAGGRVYFRESFPSRSSWHVFEELSLELQPTVNETMPGQDGLKAGGVEGSRLDELEHASLVFRSSCLESDDGKVLAVKTPADGGDGFLDVHGFPLTPLNGFLSGASLCGTAPSMPRRSQFNAGRRWRSQTVIGSGLAPSAAFGSRAVRPSESRWQRQSMASRMVQCRSRR